MNRERWICASDKYLVACDTVRVGDVASRFHAGDSVQAIVCRLGITTEQAEAAIRTAMRAGKNHP